MKAKLELQRELNKISSLLNRMSIDLQEWFDSYGDRATKGGAETTLSLISEAESMINALKGDNQ